MTDAPTTHHGTFLGGTTRPMGAVLADVVAERQAQETKFPDQHLPDGTSGHEEARRTRDMYRRVCQSQADNGRLTWWAVLREEFYEVGAETTPDALYAELIQTAAVAVRWAEDIRRRAALPAGPTLDATMAARDQDDAATRSAGADQ